MTGVYAINPQGNPEAEIWLHYIMSAPGRVELPDQTVLHWVPPHFHIATHKTHTGTSFHVRSRFNFEDVGLYCDGEGTVIINGFTILKEWGWHQDYWTFGKWNTVVPWIYSVVPQGIFTDYLCKVRSGELSIERAVEQMIADENVNSKNSKRVIPERYYALASNSYLPMDVTLEFCDRLQYALAKRHFKDYLRERELTWTVLRVQPCGRYISSSFKMI